PKLGEWCFRERNSSHSVTLLCAQLELARQPKENLAKPIGIAGNGVSPEEKRNRFARNIHKGRRRRTVSRFICPMNAITRGNRDGFRIAAGLSIRRIAKPNGAACAARTHHGMTVNSCENPEGVLHPGAHLCRNSPI